MTRGQMKLAAQMVANRVGCKVAAVELAPLEGLWRVIFKDPYADYYISCSFSNNTPSQAMGFELLRSANELMDYYEPD